MSAILVRAQEPVLTKTFRALPGVEKPTAILQYADPSARRVEIVGPWSQWSSRHALSNRGQVWIIDISKLQLKPGRHAYKFIVNGQWEMGDNREFYIDDKHQLIRPPDLVVKALHEDRNEILVYLKRTIRPTDTINVALESGIPVNEVLISPGRGQGHENGYVISGNTLTFIFDAREYGLKLKPDDRVAVAGNFNYWSGNGGQQGVWMLRDDNHDGVWELAVTLDGLRKPAHEPHLMFRFVINNSDWLPPPRRAMSVFTEANGNRNLMVDPQITGGSILKVITGQPVPYDVLQVLTIDGLADRRVWQQVSPGTALQKLVSTKPLGVTLNREQNATTYRLYAPRASRVDLCLFDTPEFEVQRPAYKRLTPRERYPMWRDAQDGVWEITLLGLDFGAYYSFNLDGPAGRGENFQPDAFVSDPNGLASAHAENNTIVMDMDATNRYFSGWTDTEFVTPAFQDMVIYETHLRDLTMHPSSGVPPHLRGKYAGLIASEGTGTGLDHLKDLGINMIEFLPMQEFNNGAHDYNWGYTTVHYFAPEASYAREPLKGSQVYEFKNLVNELHRRGFGVMIDVVYNHVGWPNLFALIDRKYYFRLTPDYHYLNFSGVGNDFRTESPMARRLIVDSIKHFVREYKIDGFRWDLAELVDMETLMEAKRESEKINPRVINVSEPWSFRGTHKEQLRGTGWAAWNNDFRYAGQDFARGRADRNWLKKIIAGSTEIWTANPLQSVNYVESHDDMALADILSLRPDRDGRNLTELEAQMNRLAATLVFTSLGIPMINEGQEFMRSKRGISNTYNRGDGVNALNWADRDRPIAARTMQYYRGLIRMRSSEAGRAFRVRTTPPPDYLQWIDPPDGRQLGFIINAPRIHPGNGFIVLMNSNLQPGEFTFNLPAGNWKIIGDGDRIDMNGIEGYDVMTGARAMAITVPEVRALILMDGF